MFFSLKFIAPVFIIAALCFVSVQNVGAQKNRSRIEPKATPTPKNPTDGAKMQVVEIPSEDDNDPNEESIPGTVIDERLAVLRPEPGLLGVPIQRMQHGRALLIHNTREVLGVNFYEVSLDREKRGWVQADAIVTTIKNGDDERLIKLIQSSEGFEQIERAVIFLETFFRSRLRPAMLLYAGDLIEETSEKLTLDANKKLTKEELAAATAPHYSFFLNYNGLDRYRKLNITFLFNTSTRYYHYDGAYWKEAIRDYPLSKEAAEAKTRMENLRTKMEKTK